MSYVSINGYTQAMINHLNGAPEEDHCSIMEWYDRILEKNESVQKFFHEFLDVENIRKCRESSSIGRIPERIVQKIVNGYKSLTELRGSEYIRRDQISMRNLDSTLGNVGEPERPAYDLTMFPKFGEPDRF